MTYFPVPVSFFFRHKPPHNLSGCCSTPDHTITGNDDGNIVFSIGIGDCSGGLCITGTAGQFQVADGSAKGIWISSLHTSA